MTEDKLAMLEAMLFTTDKPLSVEALEKALRIKKESIEQLLKILRQKYSNPDSGIKLSETGGYRLIVKEQYLQKVSHLTPHADLSRGLLRVLSVIAYKEPIKQSDIVKVVGNRTYEYVKDLVERGLIKTEKKSRTRILTTTPHFEEYFGKVKQEIKASVKEKKQEEKIKKKDDDNQKTDEQSSSVSKESDIIIDDYEEKN